MPTYYWYDDAIINIVNGGGMVSSKGGKSSEHWGGSTKAGKSTEVNFPVWWGGSYGGKARKMIENGSEVVKEHESGKPRRMMVGKADKEGLRANVEAVGKAGKEDGDVMSPLTATSSEDDAVFFAYELQTAMPSGYHTVSAT